MGYDKGPSLSGARIEDADFSGARLHAPNFEGAKITDAWALRNSRQLKRDRRGDVGTP